MTYKIPPSISSLSELSNLMIEIKKYSSWYSSHSIMQMVSKKSQISPPKLSTEAVALIKEYSGGKPLNKTILSNLIDDLEKNKKNNEIVTITLAAPVTNEIKNNLVNWFRDNINPTILVNFQFSATILGGMVVRYKSRIYDWSFRKKILDNRLNFPEILTNVQ